MCQIGILSHFLNGSADSDNRNDFSVICNRDIDVPFCAEKAVIICYFDGFSGFYITGIGPCDFSNFLQMQ